MLADLFPLYTIILLSLIKHYRQNISIDNKYRDIESFYLMPLIGVTFFVGSRLTKIWYAIVAML